MADRNPQDEWSARRDQLDRKLDRHRAQRESESGAEKERRGGMQGMAQGLKIASEFVAGIAVGAFIGYGIDLVAGTSPFGLIVFLMFGFAAGVLNVVRGARAMPTDGKSD